MEKKLSAILCLALTVGACAGQTGEEDPAPRCKNEPTTIPATDASPIGIVPAEALATIEGSSTYDSLWGYGINTSGPVRIDITQPIDDEARFVEAHPTDMASEGGCPDYVTFDVTVTLASIDDDSLSALFQATARIYRNQNGASGANGMIVKRIPKTSINGTLIGSGEIPGGTFEEVEFHAWIQGGTVTRFTLDTVPTSENYVSAYIVGSTFDETLDPGETPPDPSD